MVRNKWFWLSLLIAVLSGCAFLSEVVCDLYRTEDGGWRSHRTYREYISLNDTLPPSIKKHKAYRLFKDKNTNTGEVHYLSSNYYIIFLDRSRALTYSIWEKLNKDSFNPPKGNMAFYQVKEGHVFLYKYVAANCGEFWKNEIIISGEGEFCAKKVRSNTPVVSYFRIVDSVPDVWLKDIEVDW